MLISILVVNTKYSPHIHVFRNCQQLYNIMWTAISVMMVPQDVCVYVPSMIDVSCLCPQVSSWWPTISSWCSSASRSLSCNSNSGASSAEASLDSSHTTHRPLKVGLRPGVFLHYTPALKGISQTRCLLNLYTGP